ncbi:hypothetical protein [Spongiactinospora sp. 9N601]|uniref:hypothetical protein n=1 Tax=Spongiactinospora sp. 9N601 TaxID=3375149 RepID=UPI0037A2472D
MAHRLHQRADHHPTGRRRLPAGRRHRAGHVLHFHTWYLTYLLDPRIVWQAPPGAHLAIAAITGLRSYAEEDDPDTPGRWVATRSAPGDVGEFATYQVGDRPLWDEVVDAYRRWVAWGEPGRDRSGMTVTPDGQQVWLDTPQQVIG